MPGPAFPFDRRIWCLPHLKPGGCRRRGCSLRHDFLTCACGWIILEEDTSHQRSMRHRAFELQGRQPGGLRNAGGTTRCEQCNKPIPTNRYGPHVQWHQRMRRRTEIAQALADAERDKEGISVSGLVGVDFGVLDVSVAEQESMTSSVTITKTDDEARIMLSQLKFEQKGASPFVAELIGPNRNKWIWTNRTRVVALSFHGTTEGRYEDNLTLLFRDVRNRKYFAITRKLTATIGDVNDHELLAPVAPYVRRNWAPLPPPESIERSNRPPQWSPAKFGFHLPSFDAPSDLIEACFGPDGRPSEAVEEIRQKFLPRFFNITTYGDFFQILLHIEEEKLKRDLDQYAMTGVALKPNYPRYNLPVTGLSEGRPSVLVGDFILVKETGSPGGKWYEGRVQHVYEDHVSLAFSDGFNTYKGNKFDVRFVFNRLPHRRMHFAMSYRYKPLRLIFPDERHVANVQPPTDAEIAALIPVDRRIGSNPEQMKTVCSIMNMPRGCAPFIIFGPPGTGKTMTLVETINQLIKRDPDIRILACAPSNSAADLIAAKLTALGPSRLFRLNSLSRKVSDLDTVPELKPFVLINEHRVFSFPEKEQLERFNVIVSTCISGGVPGLLGLGIRPGHFAYVFIDEAGQAKEPEALIPIMCNANQGTNVVLAGDNQQLGPVMSSNLAAALGLRKSYLSRLMEMPVYDLDGPQPPRTIVKLVMNFRSHPKILKYPNDTFYGGELRVCGDPVMIQSLETVEELPMPKFPLAFHAVIGKDQREQSSPSFFNVEEASLVRRYAHGFIQNRKYRITEKDIGIITPYHAQRCKIREVLQKVNLTQIKVGSVEEFQGQERRVIIISTVRSSSDHLSIDIRRNLGFVAEPRRFNVAVTRAQSLLIVIGNPYVLSLDPIWAGFLEYIKSEGGWAGMKVRSLGGSVDDRLREEEERLASLRELILRAERSDGFLLNEDELEDENDDGQGDEDYVERTGYLRLDE